MQFIDKVDAKKLQEKTSICFFFNYYFEQIKNVVRLQ